MLPVLKIDHSSLGLFIMNWRYGMQSADTSIFENGRISMSNISWKCHVCGKERPDDKISVFSKPIALPDGRVIGETNIRYCNDSPECLVGASKVDFLKGKGRAK